MDELPISEYNKRRIREIVFQQSEEMGGEYSQSELEITAEMMEKILAAVQKQMGREIKLLGKMEEKP